MKYHSQNGETAIVLKYFRGKKGTVLEVGANDGKTFSNSYDLIENGWQAYLLEPGGVFELLQFQHENKPNVCLYNFGISKEMGVKVFYESASHVPGGYDTGLVSTTNAEELEKWKGVEFTETVATFITFENFVNLVGTKPIFDFISIDVEGSEWEVLSQMNLKKLGCRMLCIEWNSKPELRKKFTDYVKKFGLREIHRNAENLIFAR